MKKVTFTALVQQKVTVTAEVDDSVNQNNFKDWLKTCPVSIDGGQTITWENLPTESVQADTVVDDTDTARPAQSDVR